MIFLCAPPANCVRRSWAPRGLSSPNIGLAGARIDRIAKAADASKERLYAHFRDKEALFRSVVATDAAEFFAAVTLRPDAIPEFVGDIYDLTCRRPEHLRMMTWASLEGFALDPPPIEDPGLGGGPRHPHHRNRPGRRPRRRVVAADGPARPVVRHRPGVGAIATSRRRDRRSCDHRRTTRSRHRGRTPYRGSADLNNRAGRKLVPRPVFSVGRQCFADRITSRGDRLGRRCTRDGLVKSLLRSA